jgi:hypothetical protein
LLHVADRRIGPVCGFRVASTSGTAALPQPDHASEDDTRPLGGLSMTRAYCLKGAEVAKHGEPSAGMVNWWW